MRVELHPDARAELRSAALWYDERTPGLGDDFLTEVYAALNRIGEAPASHPTWPGTGRTSPAIQRAIIQRFPYLIAFEKHEQHALVLAVAHGRRRPLYWLSRANP